MESHESNGLLGLLLRPVTIAFHVTSLLWQKATQDGHLGQAGRMGLDEIGQALKAFPDSIHGTAHGSADNGYCGPSPSEIAGHPEDRPPVGLVLNHGQAEGPSRSPSEIVAEHGSGQGQGSVHGRDQDDGPPRSPSQIVADHQAAAGMEQSSGGQMMVQGPRPGQSWQDWLKQRGEKSGGNAEDGYERDENRNLPEEEREKSRDNGRGR